MYDLDAEVALKIRAACPHCQTEMDKAVAMMFAYMFAEPLNPALVLLMDTMEEQGKLLETLQGKCCHGGD